MPRVGGPVDAVSHHHRSQATTLMTGLNADAAAIGMFFPSIATELAGVAETSEMVAKPIDFLIEIGPYGGLIAAVMPFALQIAANHRMLDASRLASQGVVPPEVLEAQMQAKVARLQADALREQQAAVQEAQAAMRDFEAMSREPQRVA